MAISTLGAGFTFGFILNDVKPPAGSMFDAEQVRFFLAMSWFLFILALAFGSLVTLALNFWADQVVCHWNENRGFPIASFMVSVVLVSVIVAPFVFVCLVIMTYEKSIGIAGVTLVAIVWCGSFVSAILRLRIDFDDIKKAISRSAEELHLT